MPYITKDDLSPSRVTAAEMVQLTDDTGSGAANDAVTNTILVQSSALVDSYCRQRYQVPLQASDQVKGLCSDIATYKLFLRRNRVSEEIRQAYVDALAFLKDVSAGKAGLDQPATATPQSGSGDVQVTQIEQAFSDDNLKGFV